LDRRSRSRGPRNRESGKQRRERCRGHNDKADRRRSDNRRHTNARRMGRTRGCIDPTKPAHSTG
jgi:hypothetical protein